MRALTISKAGFSTECFVLVSSTRRVTFCLLLVSLLVIMFRLSLWGEKLTFCIWLELQLKQNSWSNYLLILYLLHQFSLAQKLDIITWFCCSFSAICIFLTVHFTLLQIWGVLQLFVENTTLNDAFFCFLYILCWLSFQLMCLKSSGRTGRTAVNVSSASREMETHLDAAILSWSLMFYNCSGWFPVHQN